MTGERGDQRRGDQHRGDPQGDQHRGDPQGDQQQGGPRRDQQQDQHCAGDTCVTCSDTAVEVTVIRLLADGLALVDTGQGTEEVSVALVEAGEGDTILVHAAEAIAVVPEVIR